MAKGMPQWIEAKTVAVTMPMRMEFQLDLIVQEARSAGKQFCTCDDAR